MPDAPLAARRLLDWYDVHARVLPWRAPPGAPEPSDPYRVWLSEIMAQQVRVAACAPVFERFVARWPGFEALAAADVAEVTAAWAGLGRYARVPRLIAGARAVVAGHGGRLPADEAALLALPGVGRYTAAAVRSIAFGAPVMPVDGNVERVASRLFGIDAVLPSSAGAACVREAADALTVADRPGDLAQAVMDLGATVCTPRPACDRCPIADLCVAHARGDADRLPVRRPAAARKRLRANLFWLQAGDHVLLVHRPPTGRLPGALALPTGEWTERPRAGLDGAPIEARWRRLRTPVTAPLSNLDVTFHIARARVPERPAGIDGTWAPVATIEAAGLPSAFRRAARAVLGRRPLGRSG